MLRSSKEAFKSVFFTSGNAPVTVETPSGFGKVGATGCCGFGAGCAFGVGLNVKLESFGD